jgi:hypothetical protein
MWKWENVDGCSYYNIVKNRIQLHCVQWFIWLYRIGCRNPMIKIDKFRLMRWEL